MATSADVLYNILSRMFCCSKSINSSRKKPGLESFTIDSEFSDTSTPAHKQPRHAPPSSTVKESSAAMPKDETRSGYHPNERTKMSFSEKGSQATLRSQNIGADRDLQDLCSSLSCGENNELYAKSIMDGCGSDIAKAENGERGCKHTDTKALGREQEHHRLSAGSHVRNMTSSPQLAKTSDWEGTVDISEYTRDPEGIKTAFNDPGDIISSYKEPGTGEAFDSALGASTNDMDDRKAGLESMEAFLDSKQHCESSSEDVESETEVSYAIDFHDRKTFNKVLSRRMLAFIKFRQNNTRKQP